MRQYGIGVAFDSLAVIKYFDGNYCVALVYVRSIGADQGRRKLLGYEFIWTQ